MKKRPKVRLSLSQRLENATQTGWDKGFTYGKEVEQKRVEAKFNAHADQVKRLELAAKLVGNFGQTLQAVTDAIRSVMGQW